MAPAGSRPHADAHSPTDSNAVADPHPFSDADSVAHTDSDPASDSHAGANCNADSVPSSHSHSYTPPDAHPESHAHAHGWRRRRWWRHRYPYSDRRRGRRLRNAHANG